MVYSLNCKLTLNVLIFIKIPYNITMPIIRIDPEKEKKKENLVINPAKREELENKKLKEENYKKMKKSQRIWKLCYLIGVIIFFALGIIIICAINYGTKGYFGL